jgi:linoleoyl-CoA desaturase
MQPPRFSAKPQFYNELRSRVNAYFEQTNQAPTGNWKLYSKAIFLIAAHITVYTILVFFTPSPWLALPLSALLGFLTAGIGFNVMHDGSHQSFSKKLWLNRLAGFSLSLLGGSNYMWSIKHCILHHTFTNVDGVDDDINVQPMMRMSGTQKHRWFHKFQQFYFVVLYSLMYLFWFLFFDYKKYFRSRVGDFRYERLKWYQHIFFWLGKVLSFGIFIAVPLYVVGPQALVGILVFMLFTGFLISIIFQLAHTVEDTEFPMPDDQNKLENEWAVHQVLTTANFATRSRLVTWFCGGLNFQIEHHLFPKVSHVHYPRISRIVKETCAEYDINYIEFPRITNAVASHWRMLRDMGRAA